MNSLKMSLVSLFILIFVFFAAPGRAFIPAQVFTEGQKLIEDTLTMAFDSLSNSLKSSFKTAVTDENNSGDNRKNSQKQLENQIMEDTEKKAASKPDAETDPLEELDTETAAETVYSSESETSCSKACPQKTFTADSSCGKSLLSRFIAFLKRVFRVIDTKKDAKKQCFAGIGGPAEPINPDISTPWNDTGDSKDSVVPSDSGTADNNSTGSENDNSGLDTGSTDNNSTVNTQDIESMKLKRITSQSKVTSDMGKQAWKILKANSSKPYGTRIPFTSGKKQYVAVIEKHYHEPGGPAKPWGWHKGVSLFEPADEK